MRAIITNSADETMGLAERMAAMMSGGDLIALNGDLGTGKTVFVKGLAKGLDIKDHLYVNSPTFVILREYEGRMDLYHFDVYRLDITHFCETLDYERYFYGKGLTVVEWANKVKDVLPEEHLEIILEYEGGNKRRISFRGVGERFKKIVDKI